MVEKDIYYASMHACTHACMHTHTTVLLLGFCLGLPGWASIRKVKPLKPGR